LESENKIRINFWYIILFVWGFLLLQGIIRSRYAELHLPYSDFIVALERGEVDQLRISDKYIHGVIRDPNTGESKSFSSVRIDPELVETVSRSDVHFEGIFENTFFRDLLGWILPTLLLLGGWVFVIRYLANREGFGGGGFLAVGKSRARIYMEESTRVTFRDVAGVDEAKEELKEIITFLKEPSRYGRLGGRLPKGILLVGPPGTGKTLLARAVAGEAGVPFFSISGSEFVELFVGVGAARVRDLFEQARSKAPCIIFIDELDALGKARGFGAPGGGHDEKEQTLNQLLAELDGFDPSVGVVLLAATNRPEILDSALLRAGRFDRQVLVDRPDKRGREQILSVHIKGVVLGRDVRLEELAALTPGFTGADLANLVNEAALLATRREGIEVAMSDFTNAIERIIAGLEKKNRLFNPKEREIVAYHELGHALVSLALPGADPVVKVSIIPRGLGSLGHTISRPVEDRYLISRKDLMNKMIILFGGRTAESIIFGQVSTGAADDLMQATEIARSMVTRYGMEDSLGAVAYENIDSPYLARGNGTLYGSSKRYSEQTAYKIDQGVRELVEEAMREARIILEERRELLSYLAEILLERETFDGAELEELITNFKPIGQHNNSKAHAG